MGFNTKDIKGIGVTNQRETAVAWNRDTGEPLQNTIVWSDFRTDELVHSLKEKKNSDIVKKYSGLEITSYFTAVKYKWMLENDKAVKKAVKDGVACFGTVDSWLIFKLTGGTAHVTDVTNASRTLLMNLKTLKWDPELLDFFGIPQSLLPKLCSSSEVYGHYKGKGPLEGVPIAGCLGDQQAALLGQKCFNRGEAKCTFGTGAFMLFNTGKEPVESKHGLITTVAFQLKNDVHYALEGSMAVAGSSLRWLRDNLKLINTMEEVSDMAEHTPDTGGVFFVTAFSGLFAPYWREDARGTVVGLSAFTTKYHLARATLESMSFQSRAILQSMNKDSNVPLKVLKVDGGVSNSNIAMQIQADVLGIQVERPTMRETTAFGAAIAAGLAVGIWDSVHSLDGVNVDNIDRFTPSLGEIEREKRYSAWMSAVDSSLHWKDDIEDS